VADLPHVTVAVAVKDRRERMLACLEGVLAQSHPRFDVLVVDNGSTDGTVEAVLERAASAPVPVRVEHAGGLIGAVRNAAARAAEGEVIAFTDSDCVPSPGWLAGGAAAFADPGVGVATGTTLPAEPPPYGPWHATIGIDSQTWRFETCNAFFRREALLAAGGFPEDLTMWEDTVAGWSMLVAGWEARFVPEAVVRHDVTYPGYRWHLRRAARYGQCAAAIRRHPRARAALLHGGLFLRARDAELLAGLTGFALARRHRGAALLAVPYLLRHRPGLTTPGAQLGVAQEALLDLTVLASLLRGSLRARRLVL
jgi:glycosyltransferase involved in cell wall biosynthesis